MYALLILLIPGQYVSRQAPPDNFPTEYASPYAQPSPMIAWGVKSTDNGYDFLGQLLRTAQASSSLLKALLRSNMDLATGPNSILSINQEQAADGSPGQDRRPGDNLVESLHTTRKGHVLALCCKPCAAQIRGRGRLFCFLVVRTHSTRVVSLGCCSHGSDVLNLRGSITADSCELGE